MKKIISILLTSVLLIGAIGCGTSDNNNSNSSNEKSSTLSGSITGSGSSALLPLAKDAAEKFKEKHPDVAITLNGGGSGTGLKQVADKSVDIGNSDVACETKLDETKAKNLVDHKVCVISMTPIINKDIAAEVKNVTKTQLQDIFTGKITNWKEVGGPDEKIILVTRPSTSGTRALFKEFALDNKDELSNASLETDDSGTLLKTVSTNKGAIGYVALSYLVNNKSVAKLSIDGVEASLDTTYSGDWKVWGYEHMYTNGEPNDVTKAYLDYVMGEEYGKQMESLGYNVTSKMKVKR